MKLLESTSPVVRGKAFLVVLEIVKNSHDMLLLCCQSRYVSARLEENSVRVVEMTTTTPGSSADSFPCVSPHRLVMYIERDTRKQTLSKSSDAQHMEYISRCLDLLVVNLTNAVPVISSESNQKSRVCSDVSSKKTDPMFLS